MCCLSCLPICTSSVRTLSVNFLFVTPSFSCRKSLCWIGCYLLLPHLSFSSNSWWRWDCYDKTAQKPPQQRWRECNVGASEISLILWHNLLDDDDGGTLAISSNSWQRQDCDGKTAQRPPQWLWQDCDIGASAITFNLTVWHLWQWRWRRVGNLLEFLTAVTLQCQRIGSLTTTACNALANSLIQRCLWVGSWVVACWSWHLPLGRVSKFGSGTKLFETSFLAWGPEFKTILKIPGFWFFFKSIVPAETRSRYYSRQISF